jgi:hypothetical protein
MHFKSRRLPFGSQSRERRKAAFISVKNEIRRHAGVLGGLFSTDDYLHGKNGWIDCFFLGSKPPVFYNCVIDTTRNAYKEQVRELAYEQSYALVPPSERSLFDHAVKDPISGLWAISLPEEERFAALDGLSRRAWIERQIPSIANEGEIKVHEGWTLHHDYRFGIGLHVTLDVPYLTIEAVNAFIHRFLATEAAYANPNPVSYRYDEMENWHIESNAMVEPGLWQKPLS